MRIGTGGMYKTLFIFWIALAFFAVGYNTLKIIPEIREWVPISDKQKREKIFADGYTFPSFIASSTPENSTTLLFAKDGMIFYYGRYLIYPRRLVWVNGEKKFSELTKNKKYTYIASYDNQTEINGYKKTATFSSKITGKKGAIYQKQ